MNNSFIIYNENLDNNFTTSSTPNLDATPDAILLNSTGSAEKHIRDNSLNPKYIKSVYHLFDIDTLEYRYSTIVYTKTRIKNLTKAPSTKRINLLEYRNKVAKNAIRDLIFDSIFKPIESSIIIETNYNVYGLTNTNKIKSEKQIIIKSNLWELQSDTTTSTTDNSIDTTVEITNSKAEYHKSKSNIDTTEFPIIDSSSLITNVILDEIKDYSLVRQSTINSILTKYNDIINIDWKWIETINHPCYYKHGIEQTNTHFDNNSYFIYFNDKIIRNWIATNATRSNFTKLIFRYGIALLYINEYLTTKKDKLTVDLVVYSVLTILQKYFIQNISIEKNGVDWIRDANLSKFIRKIMQYCEEIDCIKDALDNIKSDRNGCMFPAGWTTTMKSEWKSANGVKRNDGNKQKERKDKGEKHMFTKANNNQSRIGMKYKKELNVELIMRILELRNQGLSFKKIGDELGMSKSNVIKIFNKSSELG